MKVKTWVHFDEEVEVEVHPDEFMAALNDDDGWGPKRIIARCHSVFVAISDGQILEMEPEVRKTIMNALIEQADRYKEPTP
jgi:hypothetical protein|tara:strand:+ start:483 stop:725 length:243 start_codon:yes stop_codon:yes gene_type:complete